MSDNDMIVDFAEVNDNSKGADFVKSEHFLNISVQYKGKKVQLSGIGLESIVKGAKYNNTQKKIAKMMIDMVKQGKNAKVHVMAQLNGPKQLPSDEELEDMFYDDDDE